MGVAFSLLVIDCWLLKFSRFSTIIAGHHLRGCPIPPPGQRPSSMATEKAAYSIPVDNFQSDQDSFDDWVKLNTAGVFT